MDRRMKGIGNSLLALLLAAALFAALPLSACAEERAPEENILEPAALQEMVEGFLRERGIPAERVGIGFYYPETGEEWYYNPDTWFYPASMYKVPLMMLLAERVSRGELAQDSDLEGLPLSTVEEYILTYSNNDWAHTVRSYLGGDAVWRAETMAFARMEEAEYNSDFIDYGYFSPRYMTQVLETLYENPDRFPNILDCMLQAEQAHYFRLADEMHIYSVAQKYGSFCDDWGNNWNHTAGVIFTEHPFILTVMTLNAPEYEWTIGHFAVLFKDYVLGLEKRLPAVEQIREENEAAREAAAKAAAEQAEAERLAAERAAEQAAQQAEAERLALARAQQRQRILLIAGIAVLIAALIALVCVLIARARRRRRYEGYRRRFEEELRQEAQARRMRERKNN